MADINVVRKGPTVWPWIVGLIVVAIIIWAIAAYAGTGQARQTDVLRDGFVPYALAFNRTG